MKKNKYCISLFLILFFAVVLPAQKSNNIDQIVKKASNLRERGMTKDAVKLLSDAVKANPESDKLFFELGKAWGQAAQKASEKSDMMAAMAGVNNGLDALEKAVQLNPDNLEARIYYGIFAVNVPGFFGKGPKGIENLEYALKIIKDDPETEITVLQFLGKGYRDAGMFDKAVKTWDRALKLNPPEKTAAYIRENLDDAKKRLKDSKKSDKTKSIKTDSNADFKSLYKSAEQSLNKGDLKSAERFAQAALKINSNSADLHLLLGKIYQYDAEKGYDQRVYEDTNTRSDLAFKCARHFEKAYNLKPDDPEIALYFATSAVMMPFFVNKIDKGISVLEQLRKRDDLDKSTRTQVFYTLGFAYRKKGNAMWMKLIKDFPDAEEANQVYKEFGLREQVHNISKKAKHKVTISFHLGLQDELPPQTAVWVEDENGKFVKTVYVSGFSGYAKEKQVNLPIWAVDSKFETCGTTGASIDWGRHVFEWDLTDKTGSKVKPGKYIIKVESSWWPSMRYGRAETEVTVGKKPYKSTTENKPFIPWLLVEYK